MLSNSCRSNCPLVILYKVFSLKQRVKILYLAMSEHWTFSTCIGNELKSSKNKGLNLFYCHCFASDRRFDVDCLVRWYFSCLGVGCLEHAMSFVERHFIWGRQFFPWMPSFSRKIRKCSIFCKSFKIHFVMSHLISRIKLLLVKLCSWLLNSRFIINAMNNVHRLSLC